MGFLDRLFGKKEEPKESPAPAGLDSILEPGIGRIPFPAYRGNEPYIFVSYAHADSEMVFREIQRFYDQGYHVWYDEGIAVGSEWPEEIAEALSRCQVFVWMATPRSMTINVRNEIDFALDANLNAMAIHLEPTELTGGLKLRFGSKQAILKYNMTENEYIYKYTSAFERFGIRIPDKLKNAGQQKQEEKPSKPEKVPDTIKDNPAAKETANHEKTAMGQGIQRKPEEEKPVKEKPSEEKLVKETPAPKVPVMSAPVVAAPKPTAGPKVAVNVSKDGMVLPKGTAYITLDDDHTIEAVASSLVFRTSTGLFAGLLQKGESVVSARFSELRELHMEKTEDNDTPIALTYLNGEETAITADFSEFQFFGTGAQSAVELKEVTSIRFDWEHDLITEWPGFIMFLKKDGSTVSYPEALVSFRTMKTPAPNVMGTTETPHSTVSLELDRGRHIFINQVSSMALDMEWESGTRCGRRWYSRLTASIILKDGAKFQSDLNTGVLHFYGLDENGIQEIHAEDISRIDRVDTLSDALEPAEAPKISTVPKEPVSDTDKCAQEIPNKRNIFGDYVPEGTATIRTMDGTVHTAVANSLAFYAADICTEEPCLYAGIDEPGSKCANFVYFSDMEQIGREGERFKVTEPGGEISFFSVSEDAKLFFIAPKDTLNPSMLMMKEIADISFDRNHTPEVKMRYYKITTRRGAYRSPAPYLWFTEKNAGKDTDLVRDLTKYAGTPLPVKLLQKLVVTQNAENGSMFFPGHGMQAAVILKTGDTFSFHASGAFQIYSMSAHGSIVEATAYNLSCIEAEKRPKKSLETSKEPGETRSPRSSVLGNEDGIASSRGTAVITKTDGTVYTAVAGSVMISTSQNLFHGLAYNWKSEEKKTYPGFEELQGFCVEAGSDQDSRRYMLEYLNGWKTWVTFDYGRDLQFYSDGIQMSVNIGEIKSVRFDWEQDLIADWPEFARFHLKDGAVYVYPLPLTGFAMMKTPEPNIVSTSEKIRMVDALKFVNGEALNLRQVKSIAFDYSWLPVIRCDRRWFQRLSASMVLKNGNRVMQDIDAGQVSFVGVDSLGSIWIPLEELERIDIVSKPDEIVEIAEAPDFSSEKSAVEERLDLLKELPMNRHVCGDYVPKGTAMITTEDGKIHTAIANSLVFCASGLVSGEETEEPRLYGGIDEPGSDCSNFVYFSYMEEIERVGEKLNIIDLDDEETEFEIAEGSQLWFIERNDTVPSMIPMGIVRSVTFDRTRTPEISIPYFDITTRDGVYRSPVPFLWFTSNDGKKLVNYLTEYSDLPLPLRRLRRLAVTQTAADGGGFSPPRAFSAIAILKSGAACEFYMTGNFSIYSMGGQGKIVSPTKYNLLNIETVENT